jgi:starch synthase
VRPVDSVWHVARECAGVAEAGGVKDMVRGLAEAQARAGMAVTVVLPRYGFTRGRLAVSARPVAEAVVRLPDPEGWSRMTDEPVTVWSSSLGAVRLFLVDSPRFADKRDVYTWTAEDERENQHRRKGTGHWDAHHMNLLLQRGALEAAAALGETPSVFHGHDGHASFLPAIAREDPHFAPLLRDSRMVVTIHNAGDGYHQEIWDPRVACLLTGLDEAVIAKSVLRGKADPFLLAGSYASVNTVSEQYAEEILAERDGEIAGGLGRAYRERGVPLPGITNGVDGDAWDPRFPGRSGLPAAFDPGSGDLTGKKACRQALTTRIGPREAAGQPRAPLFSFVGRLTGQKGVDVLQAAIRILAEAGECPPFVVLGTGETAAEGMMRALERDLADRFAFVGAWDPALADLIYAASDFLVLPSVYEPCGLADFHGQAVGAVPLVHAVGGLRKVRDGETGYSYGNQDPSTLAAAIRRCARIHREAPEALETVRRRAFREIFELHTWDRVHRDGYQPLYRATS